MEYALIVLALLVIIISFTAYACCKADNKATLEKEEAKRYQTQKERLDQLEKRIDRELKAEEECQKELHKECQDCYKSIILLIKVKNLDKTDKKDS